MKLLKAQDEVEAANFKTTITIAVEAANRAHKGAPSPVMAEMTRKILRTLNAA